MATALSALAPACELAGEPVAASAVQPCESHGGGNPGSLPGPRTDVGSPNVNLEPGTDDDGGSSDSGPNADGGSEEGRSLEKGNEGGGEVDVENDRLKSEVASLESRLRAKYDLIEYYARLRKKGSSKYEDLKTIDQDH